MRFSVSDTAEYGDYVSGPRVTEGAKAAMQDVLGRHPERRVRDPLDRGPGGRRRASSSGCASRTSDHQIEQVGARPPRQDAVPQPGRRRGGPGAGGRERGTRGGERMTFEAITPRYGGGVAAGSDPDLRHDPARRRAGARRRPDRRGEARGRPPARAAQGRRHRGRLPGRVARRLRGGPADRPGDEGRDRGRRARALPRRRPAAGRRGDRRRRAAAPPRVHRHQRHPPQAQAPDRPRGGARARPSAGCAGPARRWAGTPRSSSPPRTPRAPTTTFLLEVYEAVVEAGASTRQHPGHRRLRDPVGVRRARRAGRGPDRRRRDRSASTATTTWGSRRPTRSPRSRPAPARSRSRSTASASAPATRRSRRS